MIINFFHNNLIKKFQCFFVSSSLLLCLCYRWSFVCFPFLFFFSTFRLPPSNLLTSKHIPSPIEQAVAETLLLHFYSIQKTPTRIVSENVIAAATLSLIGLKKMVIAAKQKNDLIEIFWIFSCIVVIWATSKKILRGLDFFQEFQKVSASEWSPSYTELQV